MAADIVLAGSNRQGSKSTTPSTTASKGFIGYALQFYRYRKLFFDAPFLKLFLQVLNSRAR